MSTHQLYVFVDRRQRSPDAGARKSAAVLQTFAQPRTDRSRFELLDGTLRAVANDEQPRRIRSE